MNFTYHLDFTALASVIPNYEKKTEQAIGMYVDMASKKVEASAKADRPWKDRTSRARNGLMTAVDKTKDGYEIVLYHTVEYGVMLELAHQKKYSIIQPTIQKLGPEIIKGFKKVIS